jgi:hypothetical protein
MRRDVLRCDALRCAVVSLYDAQFPLRYDALRCGLAAIRELLLYSVAAI